MFIAQLGETVIGRNEEVVAANMVIVIIWRAMGWNGPGIVIPLQLDIMRLTLPSKDGTVMDLGLIKLGLCADKGGARLAFPVTQAVTVVKGYVSYGGPAVLNDGVGREFGHSFMVLIM